MIGAYVLSCSSSGDIMQRARGKYDEKSLTREGRRGQRESKSSLLRAVTRNFIAKLMSRNIVARDTVTRFPAEFDLHLEKEEERGKRHHHSACALERIPSSVKKMYIA